MTITAISDQAQIVAKKEFLEGAEIHFGLKRYNLVTNREGGIFQLKEGELMFD